MKSNTGWFEISSSVAVLMVAMLVVMWAQRPAVLCTMPPEAVRRLVLTRETDREHLSRHRAEADRIEQRYSGSGTISAQAQSACEDTLVQQIMATHGVTADQVGPGVSPAHK